MSRLLHFIVTKWRDGWAVNVEADRLSDHPTAEAARAEAARLAADAAADGEPAQFVDLTRDGAT